MVKDSGNPGTETWLPVTTGLRSRVAVGRTELVTEPRHFVEKTETQQETSFFRILKNEGQSYVNTRMSKDFVENSNKGQRAYFRHGGGERRKHRGY